MTLEDTVFSVVEEFVRNNELFTALDVSNKVKETVPSARHREVRDEVKRIYTTEIEPFSYGKSPIDVNLSDGTVVQAMLYHPLSDSWDLETKYDAQKRSQSSTPTMHIVNGLWQHAPTNAPTPAAPTPNTVPATSINPWGSMFGTQPSLFPRR